MISFYTRALLLLRRPPCWNKHGAARTTQHITSRHDSHDTSCLSRRDVTQQVEFGLNQSVAQPGSCCKVECGWFSADLDSANTEHGALNSIEYSPTGCSRISAVLCAECYALHHRLKQWNSPPGLRTGHACLADRASLSWMIDRFTI